MRTKFFTLLAIATIAVTMQSCASLFTKSKQEVTFKGIPGSTITDEKNNNVIGQIGNNGFATAKIRKGLSSKKFLVTCPDYNDGKFSLGTKVHGAFWANIIFGGIPGMAIDAATGKMMKYKTNFLDVTLVPKEKVQAAPQETAMPLPERVSRNKPGATDMEKAVLRWFFDSDPRGARIYYRVISSVPDEVKNTNEAYLTTTPLEETRGFNIPGLTYDNARGVTIEIKVTKRGYEDQVKRYNVRQAIDQQEISAFFELVPKN